MYSEHFDPRANLTDKNALKVLLRLIERYMPQEDERGYLAWKEASRALNENPERIPQVARIAKELISPKISEIIDILDEHLKDLKAQEVKAQDLNAFAENATAKMPALSFLFDATSRICESHEEALRHVKILLREHQFDLRSLDRAANTLTVGTEKKFEQYDALLAIVRANPNS